MIQLTQKNFSGRSKAHSYQSSKHGCRSTEIPPQVMVPGAFEVELYQKGIVTCRLDPASIDTFGTKLINFVEFIPVVSLLLVSEQPDMTEGQNWIVDVPVPREFEEGSLMKNVSVSGVPVPPPHGFVI